MNRILAKEISHLIICEEYFPQAFLVDRKNKIQEYIENKR